MKVTIEGYSSLTGRPEVILEVMKEARMFDSDMSSEDYIQAIRQTAWRVFGITLDVNGTTPAERAESLLRAMNEAGLIRIEEE